MNGHGITEAAGNPGLEGDTSVQACVFLQPDGTWPGSRKKHGHQGGLAVELRMEGVRRRLCLHGGCLCVHVRPV